MAEIDKTKLIKEEQKVVNQLIATIEKDIKESDERLQNILWNHRKAKEIGPDAYGMLVDGLNAKKKVLNGIQRAQQSKDELYTCRLILECDDGDGKGDELELKIGLSTYSDKNGNVLICEWKMDVCRHFLLDNCAEEYDGLVIDKHDEKTYTHYKLKMKRNVETRFSFVKDVTHLFPLSVEEAEKIIFDVFLSELVNRRSNTEFQNIIFSIQKKQGEIIKLPYDEDIIVQGCAGSGKSMIMLHRLPILLYDNPEKLNSSNVYIISPSETYIQMVDQMREDLEIADLKMGTINQYYDYVLSKYGTDLDKYGRISYATGVTREQEEYVYGKQLSTEIKKLAKQMVNKKDHDFSEGTTILGLSKRKPSKTTIDAEIMNYILEGTNIITTNDNVLKEYYNLCIASLNALKDIVEKTKNRRIYIMNEIKKRISEDEEVIKNRRKELENTTLGELAIKNRQDIIENALSRIVKYKDVYEQVENDDEYFLKLSECCVSLEKVLDMFGFIKSQYEKNSSKTIYFLLKIKKKIYKGYWRFVSELEEVEEKYLEYSDSMIVYTNKYDMLLSEVITKNSAYLDEEDYNELVEITNYYRKLKESIVQDIYLQIMSKCGQVPNEKGEIKGLKFSPYLYLKIMYVVKGATNISQERLICIDEAQGLAPEELKLIKEINGDRLILNLFGDVKQHIEGTKGIDSWEEFSESINVKEQLLMENYRNASQITEECNRRFQMRMKAINTPGSGVTTFESYEQFENKIHNIFINVHKPGIRAIIVNDTNEAKQLTYQYEVYQDKIHDMTRGHFDFHRTKWNS